jgi:hypothetical protein
MHESGVSDTRHNNAPATTSVGTAGTGKPICSTSMLMKTTRTPYSVMS